jgi:predicted anti-sigma-YlaC factor YlaD
VQCAGVVDQLLAADDDLDVQSEVERHLADCSGCATLAQRLGRLDSMLQSSLVIEPPLELQHQLAELARAAARPAQAPWWQRLRAWFDGLVAARPSLAMAQGLAALMLVLAGWQVLGFLNTFTPMVGDVPYAMELVASSPAAAYLGGIQLFDAQSLLLWSGVGVVGWLFSESGPIGRRRVVG